MSDLLCVLLCTHFVLSLVDISLVYSLSTLIGQHQGRNTGGCLHPPSVLTQQNFTQIYPTFTQQIPNNTQLLPNFTQLLPNFTQLLPNSTQLLPNFFPTLPNFYPTLRNITQFYLPQNFFRAFGAKTLPNSKIFTQLHPPGKVNCCYAPGHYV